MMTAIRGKDGVNAVLAAGPAQLFADRGFTRRRLHFYRPVSALIHVVTFEVERFYLGERVVPFHGVVWTTCPEIHELITGQSFPKSPISGVIASHTEFERLRGPGSPSGWEVDVNSPDSITETADDVYAVVSDYALPFLDELQSLDDLLRLYGDRASDYHAVSIQAAVHVLQKRPESAVRILSEWRDVYTSGTPESQLRNRADVCRFAKQLGIELPTDNYVPISVQEQLCERLREECERLSRGHGRYNHAENLFREIVSEGPPPPEIEELYRKACHAIWPTMSTRQLCRMAKKMCNSAARASETQAQLLYNDAHLIFTIVAGREGVPDAYREFAATAARHVR